MTSSPSLLSGRQKCHGRFAAIFAMLFATILSQAVAAIPLQTPGNFDPLFAGGLGKIASLSISAGNDHAYAAVALQPDGKIVMAGACSNDFCLARLNADGSLDTSFSGPGGLAAGKFMLPMGQSDDIAYALALQPDGKIVVAGACNNGVNYDFCVARLNPNGSRDSSFGGPGGAGNGLFLLPMGASDDWATAVSLQPDGKIVLAGYCYAVSDYDFCVARLNVDGTLDATFVGPAGNGNGKFLLPISTGGSKDDVLTAMALQGNGKIVLAGYCVASGNNNQFCAARLNADGSLDANFDGPGVIPGDGKFLLTMGGFYNLATALLVQPDGNIVLTGYCAITASSADFCAARLLPGNGALDPSFIGPAGSGDGRISFPIGLGNDLSRGTAIQSDGKLILAGECTLTGLNYFCTARLNGDGSLDSTFDGPSGNANGKMLLSVGTGNNRANAVAIQPDGKIVVVGYCGDSVNDDFCVARLSGGPFGNKSCTMDIDGDGKLQALTDGLMITRAMLGMTGNAVITGAVGAGATRTTWTAIRDYLVTQCGMAVLP